MLLTLSYACMYWFCQIFQASLLKRKTAFHSVVNWSQISYQFFILFGVYSINQQQFKKQWEIILGNFSIVVPSSKGIVWGTTAMPLGPKGQLHLRMEGPRALESPREQTWNPSRSRPGPRTQRVIEFSVLSPSNQISEVGFRYVSFQFATLSSYINRLPRNYLGSIWTPQDR